MPHVNASCKGHSGSVQTQGKAGSFLHTLELPEDTNIRDMVAREGGRGQNKAVTGRAEVRMEPQQAGMGGSGQAWGWIWLQQ